MFALASVQAHRAAHPGTEEAPSSDSGASGPASESQLWALQAVLPLENTLTSESQVSSMLRAIVSLSKAAIKIK